MTETLEQINKEIAAAEKQLADLNTAFQKKKDLLSEKRAQQDRALFAGEDTSKLEGEMSNIQIGIEGLYRVIKAQGKVIEELREKQRIELVGVSLTKAEKAGDQALSITKDIYLLLVDLVEETVALKSKAREFRGMLREKHPTALRYRSYKSEHLCDAIQTGLPRILEHILPETFKNEDLPTPDELLKQLHRAR